MRQNNSASIDSEGMEPAPSASAEYTIEEGSAALLLASQRNRPDVKWP